MTDLRFRIKLVNKGLRKSSLEWTTNRLGDGHYRLICKLGWYGVIVWISECSNLRIEKRCIVTDKGCRKENERYKRHCYMYLSHTFEFILDERVHKYYVVTYNEIRTSIGFISTWYKVVTKKTSSKIGQKRNPKKE